MKKTNKTVSVISAVLIMLCAIPNFTLNAFAKTYGDFVYEIKDSSVVITGYNGKNEKIEIPEEIEGKTVTAVGKEAFKGNESILTVILPDTVTDIKTKAFASCKNLKSVEFGENVKSIGISAFYGTVLYNESTNSKGETYINNCLIHVAKKANGEVVRSYTVKDDTRLVAQGAFYHDGLTYTNKNELVYPDLKTIVIASSVERVNSFAFYGCNGLTELILSEGIKYIDKNAFEKCSALKNVTLPSTLVKLDSNLFNGCEALTTVTVKGNPKLNADAFINCPVLKEVIFAEGLKNLSFSAFKNCPEIESVTIPASVTKFDTQKAENCPKLKTVKGYKGSASEIFAKENSYIFSSIGECPLVFDYETGEGNTVSITRAYGVGETLTIPAIYDGCEVKAVSESAFKANDTLVDVFLPDNITLENDAFSDCSKLRTVVLGENAMLGESFKNCPSLEAVVIPESVKSIADACFANNTKLTVYGNTDSFAKIYADANSICFADINTASAPKCYEEMLEAEIEKLESFDTSLYTEESKTAITNELARLKTLSQTDVTINDIKSAIENAENTLKNAEYIIILGDVNRDVKVSTVDAKWVLQHIANLRTLEGKSLECADVNKDGKISIIDAKWILQMVANLRN